MRPPRPPRPPPDGRRAAADRALYPPTMDTPGAPASSPTEHEIKLGIPPGRRRAVEAALGARSSVERLQAVYFDTEDGALAHRGVAVRLRREGRRWVQTVKLGGPAGSVTRVEDSVDVDGGPRGGRPALDLGRHVDPAVHRALSAALGDALEASPSGGLVARFTTDVRRRTSIRDVDGGRVEIALDVGEVAAGSRSEPILELEIEAKSGARSIVYAVAADWQERFGLFLSNQTKAGRGARLCGTEVGAERRAVDREAGDPVGALIARAWTDVVDHAAAVALDSSADEEEAAVHRLRVALRRLRASIRELGELAVDLPPNAMPVLSAAFRELGVRRDFAVVLPGELAALAAAAMLPAPVPRAPKALRSASAVVCDAAFQRVLIEVAAALDRRADEASPLPSRGALKRHVAERLGRLRKRIDRDAGRFAALETERQHAVRKRLKRLRYLGDLSAGILFEPKSIERYNERWKKAQDALGRYNDERVVHAMYEELAATRPEATAAAQWLGATQDAAVERCRRALGKAVDTKPFWR